jgi:serine/threonine protein phosphatase 1
VGEIAPHWWGTGQPQLRPGRRIYAVGDIHGHADLLRALVAHILADLARFPAAAPELIFLGDYVSRGPSSQEVLEFMTGEARQLPLPAQFLKGNHEDMLLRYLDEGEVRAGIAWLHFGGDEVFQAYGLNAPDGHRKAAVVAGAKALKAAMPARHLDFLRGLAVSLERDDYLFVHAGIRPGVKLADQTAHDMIWIRHEFLNHTGLHERFVVHGHTPARLPEIRTNRLNIDTRAYDTGVLTAVVLEGGDRRFLSTI